MEISSPLPPPLPPQNLGKTIFLESQRIMKSQPCQFLALSFLFLALPSATTVVFLSFQYPVLHDAIFNSLLNKTKIFAPAFDQHHDLDLTTVLLALGIFVINLVSSSCAVGSISYAVFHAFHGQRQVKLKSAINSLTASFFPLLATTLLLQIINFAITITTFVAALLVAKLLGFQNIDPLEFFIFFMPILLALMSVIIYLQTDWSLASVITAVEPTKWGLKSLKLSKNLMISMNGEKARGLAFSTSFIFGATQASILLVTCFSSLVIRLDRAVMTEDGWTNLSLPFAFQILVTSISLSSLQLNRITANSLLYSHCKASSDDDDHGNDFPAKYVLVPVEDKNVQRLVSVI